MVQCILKRQKQFNPQKGFRNPMNMAFNEAILLLTPIRNASKEQKLRGKIPNTQTIRFISKIKSYLACSPISEKSPANSNSPQENKQRVCKKSTSKMKMISDSSKRGQAEIQSLKTEKRAQWEKELTVNGV